MQIFVYWFHGFHVTNWPSWNLGLGSCVDSASEMTYIVSGGALNSTNSLTCVDYYRLIDGQLTILKQLSWKQWTWFCFRTVITVIRTLQENWDFVCRNKEWNLRQIDWNEILMSFFVADYWIVVTNMKLVNKHSIVHQQIRWVSTAGTTSLTASVKRISTGQW